MSLKSIYSKAKAWNDKLAERKKEPVAIPEFDHTHHICTHCGYGYDGQHCPQCGMPAEHVRFTFGRLIHNFLDIWGLGNRPMFRTMRDLIWRPGYMIRDYLGGHYLSYFPPFKMLAVFTIFIVFIALIFGFKDPLVGERIANLILKLKKSDGVGNYSAFVLDYLARMIIYLDKNDLYRIFIQNIFVVLATWLVFRKKGFNLVETFFSQIYINCQFDMIAIFLILITAELPPTVIMPYYLPLDIAFILLVFDYKQLYGLKIWGAIWRTALIFIINITFYVIIFIVIFAITSALDNALIIAPSLVQ